VLGSQKYITLYGPTAQLVRSSRAERATQQHWRLFNSLQPREYAMSTPAVSAARRKNEARQRP